MKNAFFAIVQVGVASLLITGATFVATDGHFAPSSVIGGHCDSTCFNDYEDVCTGTNCNAKLKHCMGYGEKTCRMLAGTGNANHNCNKISTNCADRKGCNCGL